MPMEEGELMEGLLSHIDKNGELHLDARATLSLLRWLEINKQTIAGMERSHAAIMRILDLFGVKDDTSERNK